MSNDLVWRTASKEAEVCSEAASVLANRRQGAHLYFVKIAKGRSPVKIGRANDPQARMATLQVACPYGLKLLGVLENCGGDEFELHWVLRTSRLRGEWFAWSKHVEETVRLALAGGDWRAMVGEERHTSSMGEWFYGSPLYESAA